MRHTFGCDQQDSSLHRNVVGFEQEQSLAFNDVVDLVHACMRVERMLLPRLERASMNFNIAVTCCLQAWCGLKLVVGAALR